MPSPGDIVSILLTTACPIAVIIIFLGLEAFVYIYHVKHSAPYTSVVKLVPVFILLTYVSISPHALSNMDLPGNRSLNLGLVSS